MPVAQNIIQARRNYVDTLKTDSHIACRAHAVPLPCRAAKGLECAFPIWFTQCGSVLPLAMPCPCRAHDMLWPRRSSQGHGTARPSRDGLWATCPPLASSGYHAVFQENCYQKHTSHPHNDPFLRLWRVVAAHYKKDDLLNCWTSSSDISGSSPQQADRLSGPHSLLFNSYLLTYSMEQSSAWEANWFCS
jgi:hypothetical protein